MVEEVKPNATIKGQGNARRLTPTTSKGYEVEKFRIGDNKQVIFTFDDGPSEYTDEILDILKTYNVKATFFVVGHQIKQYPEVLQRIYDEGHLIGNHSFAHLRVGEISPKRFRRDTLTTQRLIESTIHRSTILYRPPENYVTLSGENLREVINMNSLSSLGYYILGVDIDTRDRESNDAETMVTTMQSDLELYSGGILLLHDGGGNREATIEALPQIIESLQEDGYEITDLASARGVKEDEIMTPLPPQQKVTSILGGAVFYFWRIAKRLLQVICFIIIALGVARLLIILFFALYQKFGVTKKRLKKLQDYTPKVSILIPAYNEATVICNTLSNVLTSTYKNFEAIVIDDGSSDQTAEIARNQFGDIPNIKIIQQENGGKAAALNNGISHATGEIIIIQDADTLFDKHALEYLVKHFHNPEVAGVSGNVKVGNTHNIMGRCQAVEYITSQSLDRRAFDVLNCIVIVPGAIGARRKSVLEQVGGLKSDTLAEDCDLTVQVLRTGNRIVYEDKAVAWTEAPETVGAFLKQRFRWLFGILQVCWKNKDLVFNLRHFWLGWFSLPYMVLSLIIYPLIIPLVDLVALYGIRIIVREFMSGRTSFQQSGREIFALFTLGFVLLDRIVATIAFSLEKDKDFPLLITLPLQRIVYRFLLYRVGIKVLYIALTGKPARRNKLKRTGSATVKS